MASISIPCPKCSLFLLNGAPRRFSFVPAARVSMQLHNGRNFHVLKAQFPEAIVENSSNSSLKTKSDIQQPEDIINKEENSTVQADVPDNTLSAFLSEVSELIKLVDSRDITELQLKQKDCEIIIKKKEALQQPTPAAPVLMMQPPHGFPMQPQVSQAPPAPSSPPPSTPSLALPPAKGSNSSLPPLKSPMVGTFYCSPAPGEPPFVKVGDKVNKGQVVCIIEAMKLMNEIEADRSGTVLEIFLEDGKQVVVDTPLLIIGP
ncbi:hypothetical protein HPP92_023628 [Vanilla planifolia]|uniref:Biotin carboxyl carrier protein of acetyl-CoA carboxylase n=1 Tax=Vanilla planifolia TaxID=51239 RepID=A0A835UGF7_VANPL|nr:hypothetical protein HPP92_023628 [Vanilla planifolia]